jgi:superfamily II DNA or RNA helicase
MGFQCADIRICLDRRISLLNNDMGTGKTLVSTIWALYRHLGAYVNAERNIEVPANAVKKPVLVVTLKGVQGQFAQNMEEMTSLKVIQITTSSLSELLKECGETKNLDDEWNEDSKEGDAKSKKMKVIESVSQQTLARFYQKIEGHAFIVTTYNCLSKHAWFVQALEWAGVIFDEAHELKGIDTIRSRSIFGKNLDGAPLRGAPILAATGTFAKNRPVDWFVWVRLSGADGGVYTGGSASYAEENFSIRFDGLVFKKMKVGERVFRKPERKTPKNGHELKNLLAPFVIRRLKTEIGEIPPIVVKTIDVTSSGVYIDVIGMLRGMPLLSRTKDLLDKYKILDKNGNIKAESPYSIGSEMDKLLAQELGEVKSDSLAGKLSLISSLDKAHNITNILKEQGWIDENNPSDNNNPFVIVCMHQAAVAEVSFQLGELGIEHFLMTQKDSAEKRRQKIDAFQNGERQAFVTTYGVGGTGLNLTRAHRIMLAGQPWTATSIEQARDRIHRIGQKHPCECIILLLSGSLDFETWFMIKSKGRANYATQNIDKLREGKLPSWAEGHIGDQVKSDSKDWRPVKGISQDDLLKNIKQNKGMSLGRSLMPSAAVVAVEGEDEKK